MAVRKHVCVVLVIESCVRAVRSFAETLLSPVIGSRLLAAKNLFTHLIFKPYLRFPSRSRAGSTAASWSRIVEVRWENILPCLTNAGSTVAAIELASLSCLRQIYLLLLSI